MVPSWTETCGAAIPLPPTQDIRSCAALVRAIAERLESQPVVTLDASAFVSGDITFVQTLIAARKAADARGARIEIVHAGPAVAAVFDRCGIDADACAHFAPASHEDTP